MPLCLSSRLSCSSMPFLQRYGAADVIDAGLQLPEQSEPALLVNFGIVGRQSMLLRAYLAAWPALSPPWTPKSCFRSFGPVAGQLCVCSPLLPHRLTLARRSMADVTGMPRASWGCA